MWWIYTLTFVCLLSVTVGDRPQVSYTPPHHLADHSVYTRRILLAGGTIDTTNAPSNIENDIIHLLSSRGAEPSVAQEVISSEASHFLVQLEPQESSGVKEKIIKLIESDNIHTTSGDKLLTYVPHHSYLFVATYYTARAIAKVPGVCYLFICLIGIQSSSIIYCLICLLTYYL